MRGRAQVKTILAGAVLAALTAACAPRVTTDAEGVTMGAGPDRTGAPEAPAFDRSVPPEIGPPPAMKVPAFHRFELSNGLPVVLVEQHELPLVTVELLVRGGAAVGRAGVAALTADMLDEGTAHYDAVGLAEAVDRLGASLNTFASWDASYVDLTVLRPRLEAALELMAEVVVEPTFPEDEFERVRRERAIRVQQSKDDARTLADNQFARLLFGEAHPYGRPLLGTPELETVGRDEVLAAYRETFRAGNAGLIVAGDITADELRGLLEPTLGRMPEGEGPALDVPAPPSLAGPRIYLVDKPGAAQSEVRVGRVALPRATPEYYPAIVTNTVLGGSFTSRLNSTLREEKGYTYGAGSSFQMRRHAGPFVARAGVFTPVTDSSVVEFVRQIRRMHDEPVPEDELARAKNYVALRLPQRFETVSDLANRVSELVLYELPDDTWDGYVDGVLAVDQDDVLAFARRWLDVNDMVIVVAGDRSVIEQPLRDLGIAEVVVVPPEAVF